MTTRVRTFTLAAHIAFSVGWIGAVVVFLAFVAAGMMTPDASMVRMVWLALQLSGWFAIVPLALAALLTGLVMSLGTRWGLFRHYWTLFSLVLTMVATAVLVVNMQTVSAFARMAADPGHSDIGILRSGLRGELLHAGAGLLVLLVIQVLNVYKPRGLTGYGQRKQDEQRLAQRSARDEQQPELQQHI